MRYRLVSLLVLAVILGPFSVWSDGTDLAKIGLTESEIEWLSNVDTIRVGGPLAFPPFHYYEDGRARGIGSEYVRVLAELLGLELKIVGAIPWPQVLDGARAREIDLIAVAARTQDREEYLVFSEAYLSFPLVIITRVDELFVGGLEDLHGAKVALVEGVSTGEWLDRDGIDVVPHSVQTPLGGLEAVSFGEADAYIGNLAASSYLMQAHGLANIKIAAPTTYGSYDLNFAVRNDWPILASILDKAIASLPPELHTSIRSQWISVRYEHGLRPRDILRWVALVVVAAAAILGWVFLYNRRLRREVTQRTQAEQSLREALSQIKALGGLLPICAHCKKIRDDKGYWNQLERYLEDHSDAQFSHGVCPECAREHYSEYLESS